MHGCVELEVQVRDEIQTKLKRGSHTKDRHGMVIARIGSVAAKRDQKAKECNKTTCNTAGDSTQLWLRAREARYRLRKILKPSV